MHLHNQNSVDENKCNKTKGKEGKEGCGVTAASKGEEPDGRLWGDGQLLCRGWSAGDTVTLKRADVESSSCFIGCHSIEIK